MADYVWRTQMDDRVRPAHAAREGKKYSWADPPQGGHPGEDFGCRCWAQIIEPGAGAEALYSQSDLEGMTVAEVKANMDSVLASLGVGTIKRS